MAVNLELFYSPYCPRCRKARRELSALAAEWPAGQLSLREIDVVQALDRAVAVGVQRTPALAIDGQLVAGPVPSTRELETMVRQRLNGRNSS
ncbi:MAG: glutaredoxin family protein [Steroidobacteraceae bacterium]